MSEGDTKDPQNTAKQAKRKRGDPPTNAWKKGVSGNPGGRPGVPKHVRELAKQHTEMSIYALAKIVGDETEKVSGRVRAAEVLLNRAWGRPPEALEITGAGGGPIQLQQEAKDDLASLIASIAARQGTGDVAGEPH